MDWRSGRPQKLGRLGPPFSVGLPRPFHERSRNDGGKPPPSRDPRLLAPIIASTDALVEPYRDGAFNGCTRACYRCLTIATLL